MAYQAMARRYRPSTFEEVIGQGHVARTLQNSINANRVAHAYLFCGPHGCGKTSMARIFAKALNCTGGPSSIIPADCPICADITAGNDPDVMEIDGASNNSVDQVRSLREQAGYVPARSRSKIYIIDEVHMLSTAAFNALLKTLEEPPPHVKFILATTEPHKLLETILSRCQRFDFRLVAPGEMAVYLKELCRREGVKAAEEALEAISAYSGGSMRDGLVLLDQLISYCPEGITRVDVERVRGVAGVESIVSIFESILTHDCQVALSVLDAVSQQGTGAGDFLDQLIEYGRDLMHVIATRSQEGISAYGPARASLTRHATAFPLEMALLILDVLTTARTRVRSRALSNPQVPLEMAIARLAGLEGIESIGTVISRIESLAKSGALSGGEDVVDFALSRIPLAGSLSPSAMVSESSPPEKKTADSVAADQAPSPAEAVTTISCAYDSCARTSPAEVSMMTHAAATDPSVGSLGPEGESYTLPPWEEIEDEEEDEAPGSPASAGVFAPLRQASEEPRRGEAGPARHSQEVSSLPKTGEIQENGSPPASGTPLGLDLLKERWPMILEAIHATHPPDSRFMYDLRPVLLEEGGQVVLELPAGGVFLMEQLEDRERRKRINAAMNQVLGRTVSFRLVIPAVNSAGQTGSAHPSPGASGSQGRGGSALQEPMVKEIMDRFKCEVLNII